MRHPRDRKFSIFSQSNHPLHVVISYAPSVIESLGITMDIIIIGIMKPKMISLVIKKQVVYGLQ